MVYRCLSALACCFGVSGALAEAPVGLPRLHLPERVHDFGAVSADRLLVHRFEIWNAGQGDLRIERVEASCGCTTATPGALRLPPGGVTELEVRFDPAVWRGKVRPTVTLATSDPAEPVAVLRIEADVQEPPLAVIQEVDLGRVSRSGWTHTLLRPVRPGVIILAAPETSGLAGRPVAELLELSLDGRRLPAEDEGTIHAELQDGKGGTLPLRVRWKAEPPRPDAKVNGSAVVPMRALIPLLLSLPISAQETPQPNRVAWFAILPEPLPDGRNRVTFEITTQFLRADRERNEARGSFARLDGEEWQVTADLAWKLGSADLCLRLRGVDRSGGFLDQTIMTWHGLLNTPGGGREGVPKYRIAYHLEKEGKVVADLAHPRRQLLDADVALVRTTETAWGGYRFGASLQLPTGDEKAFGGNGAVDGLLGGALWRKAGAWTFHGQAEVMRVGLKAESPYQTVMGNRTLTRAWAGAGYQGTGSGLLSGLGLDITVAYMQSPYDLGLPRVDRTGWQQHWTITHTRLPRWQFGFSEEAGTYVSPDITGYVRVRF